LLGGPQASSRSSLHEAEVDQALHGFRFHTRDR
jgi:hypothetical protein